MRDYTLTKTPVHQSTVDSQGLSERMFVSLDLFWLVCFFMYHDGPNKPDLGKLGPIRWIII